MAPRKNRVVKSAKKGGWTKIWKKISIIELKRGPVVPRIMNDMWVINLIKQEARERKLKNEKCN